MILLDSNSNTVPMAYVDAKLVQLYRRCPACVRRSHAVEYYSDSFLGPQYGVAIRDFRFETELWFLCIT